VSELEIAFLSEFLCARHVHHSLIASQRLKFLVYLENFVFSHFWSYNGHGFHCAVSQGNKYLDLEGLAIG
jgi:hypothetical protein